MSLHYYHFPCVYIGENCLWLVRNKGKIDKYTWDQGEKMMFQGNKVVDVRFNANRNQLQVRI